MLSYKARSTGKAILVDVGVVLDEQQQRDKSFVLATTSVQIGLLLQARRRRTKQDLCGCQQSDARNLTAGQHWAPAASPKAGSRAIKPPVVMAGTSRGITSVV